MTDTWECPHCGTDAFIRHITNPDQWFCLACDREHVTAERQIPDDDA